MDADRFAEVERVYHEAKLRRAEERAAFLDQACGGDDALRKEVESLLSLQTDAGGFLSRSALEETVRTSHQLWETASWPTIPGYTVRRVLGEGGMGVVYLAEQETPFRRPVALKLIKPGMDTRQVIARFQTERQALALMDHPNIAAVFDAGSTEKGLPYFVMEFVDGVSITEYCDRERLSTRDRLALFVQVCAAVQHAHQKGVIHRDLKPSNVLVAERDGRALPKVIDFGTAKAIGGTWNATATQAGQGMVLGTLEYMSPEQAALSADIDTATDVYSLGVLLYEMLVGRLPFDTVELRAAGYDEMRRVIRESDPPKPSVRVEQRADKSGAVALARQTDAPGLTRQLRGDLDWIALKALEKDRRRRYATVAAMATDIGRFLDDQPVEARPPSSAYRIRKFARRHRGAVAAAASLFLVLVAGLVITRWQYLRAEYALTESKRKGDQAEAERVRAEYAREVAERAIADATFQKLAAEQQRMTARKETGRALAALDLADYRSYVNTIAAADAEVRASRLSQGRELLLTVPPAKRGWEWNQLFLRAAKTTPPDPSPCKYSQLALFPVATKGSDGQWSTFFTYCQLVNGWNISGASVAGNLHVAGEGQLPKEGKLVGRFDNRSIACADLSRDGRMLALGFMAGGSSVNSFEVWDVESGRRLSQITHPRPPGFSGLCFARLSPDSTLLATSIADVRVWAAATGMPVWVDSGQAGSVSQPVDFNPTSRQLAVGRRNGAIDVLHFENADWSVRSFESTDFIRPRPLNERDFSNRVNDAVLAMAFTPDGRTIVSATRERAMVWDVPSGRVRRMLEAPQSAATGLVVDGNLVYIVHLDKVTVEELDGSPGVTKLEGSTPVVATGMTMSTDGRTLGLGSTYGSLAVWNLDVHRQVVLQPAVETRQSHMSQVIPTSDARIVLTGLSTSDSLMRWDTETRQSVSLPTIARTEPDCVDHGYLGKVVVSPNDRYLAIAQGDCVVIRDLGTAETLAVLRVDRRDFSSSNVSSVRFLSNKSLLVVARHKNGDPTLIRGVNSVRLWDWTTKGITADRLFSTLTDQPLEMAVSNDGGRIALGAGDTVTIWDNSLTREIQLIKLLRKPAGYLFIALSPDGTRLATANMDRSSVMIWDTTTSLPQPLLTLAVDDTPWFLAFTPKGQLIAASTSGNLTIWDSQIR